MVVGRISSFTGTLSLSVMKSNFTFEAWGVAVVCEGWSVEDGWWELVGGTLSVESGVVGTAERLACSACCSAFFAIFFLPTLFRLLMVICFEGGIL